MLFQKQKKNPLPTKPTRYPNGSFVESENGFFYINNASQRLLIISERVLNSWSPQRVIKTNEVALSNYKVSSRLRFRNGSLIWNLSDAKIYLIEDGKRRWVVSPDVLEYLNSTMQDVMPVSKKEIELHPEGNDLE